MNIRLVFSITLIWISLKSIFSIAQTSASVMPHKEGELIVQISKGVNVYSVLQNYDTYFEFKVERELSPIMRAWLVSFNASKISNENAKRLLEQNAAFSIVQFNHLVSLRAAVPNDPQFNQQWHHQNTGQSNGTIDADIDTDEVWETTTGGTTALGHDIVVCIIEGVNLTHPDIIDNRWQNPNEIEGNGIDDDNNGYIDDIHGWNVSGNNGTVGTGSHGTSVAGMIGAKGNNNEGVVGANWNVKIMAVSGHSASDEANIISCYNYPLVQRKRFNETNGEQGAFVVATNASWGIDEGNPASIPIWCAFYDTLGYYGILNCGATTNSNLNVDAVGDIPTACSSPYMVGVGRSDRNDNFAGGYGLTTIDFVAPGINVRTTNSTAYTTTTGTSFASPLTAGVIALLYSIPCTDFANLVYTNPQQGADLVLNALLQGVDQKPQLTNFFITGGRLNAKNSMDILINNYCNGICLPPAQLSTQSIQQNSATAVWNGGSAEYQLNYRIVGSADWTAVNVTDTFFVFSNLQACTNYEYYLISVCDSINSSQTNIVSFLTSGCGNCIDLPYCNSRGMGSTQISMSITSPESIANDYGFQAPSSWGANLQNFYTAGQLIFAEDNVAGNLGCNAFTNSSNINGNIAVVYRGSCEFSLKALNAQTAGAAGIIIINNTSGNTIDMSAGSFGSQVTIPVVMMTNTNGATLATQINSGNNVFAILGNKKQWIQSASISTYNNISGQNDGYGSFLVGNTLQLAKNNEYQLNITPGFLNQPYPVVYKSWIDFNQDGEFSNDELLGTLNTNTGENFNQVISIPNSAETGNSRMRITMAYVGPGQLITPESCGEYLHGETEDYCIEITPSCDFSVSIETTDATCAGQSNGEAVVNVNNLSGNATYAWSHNNSLNVPSANNLSAQQYSVVVTDESGCSVTRYFNINEPLPSVSNYTHTSNFTTVTFNNQSSSGNYLWDFGDGNTSVETNPIHTYADSGTYNVCLSVTDNCGTVTNCQNISVEKSLDASLKNLINRNIEIYPNPAKESIFIKNSKGIISKVEICDTKGALVFSNQFVSNHTISLEISNLNNGIYFIKIYDENRILIATNKLVILKE